jgi:PAS domain S-box-containing protein
MTLACGGRMSLLIEQLEDILGRAEELCETSRAEPQSVLYALLDTVPFAALVANDEGQYVYANPAASTLLGYEPDELRALSVWALTPTVMDQTAKRLWQSFINAHELTGIYQMLTKHGEIVVAEYAARTNVLPGLHLSILHR